ncbi:ferritin-like fold-containing protein [Galbitalea sp. SE-J8]|uniref:ferritin-like fold-containing protein n=1 Tax=Galbitalea sp. SE-J8 TaxID=3054952 RepID=UPI00259CA6FB|nr:ferritin-like fold-containing protein [Galbitalea sp. SE-J8]MDM4763508.1 ferritin-like fold-containing protein [Galbitalea sp. SE-J8]
MKWFGRRRSRAAAPTVRSRSDAAAARRVDLAELTPSLLHYLGLASYVQLALFENLSRAVQTAPTADAKEAVSRVAALSLEKHHALAGLIVRHGNQPGPVMEPFAASIDEFQRRTRGADWAETLLACYLTAGFLDDFFLALAGGLSRDYADDAAAALAADNAHDILKDRLRDLIDAQPRLSSRLALWGRRLVGDTMLVARAGLAPTANGVPDEERIEPVFSELIAAHSRRMDGLGLTA